MRTRDVEKMLERNGYYLKRQNRHRLYSNGRNWITIPFANTISPGLYKAIKKQLGVL